MPLTALTRRCASCRALLPEPPAAPTCASCGREHCPHVDDWPRHLQWWTMRELAGRHFLPWYSRQEWLEGLLRAAMVSGESPTRPNRFGASVSAVLPTVQLYPRALALADSWRDARSPILPDHILATLAQPNAPV